MFEYISKLSFSQASHLVSTGFVQNRTDFFCPKLRPGNFFLVLIFSSSFFSFQFIRLRRRSTLSDGGREFCPKSICSNRLHSLTLWRQSWSACLWCWSNKCRSIEKHCRMKMENLMFLAAPSICDCSITGSLVVWGKNDTSLHLLCLTISLSSGYRAVILSRASNRNN